MTTDERLGRIEERIEYMCENVEQVRDALCGRPGEPGLIIDVDRLKISNALKNTFLWVLFTTVTGIVVTWAAKFLG